MGSCSRTGQWVAQNGYTITQKTTGKKKSAKKKFTGRPQNYKLPEDIF